MVEKELQERIVAHRILESRLDSLLKQRELIVNKIVEIQTTLESIDDIQKSDGEILFPIGSEAYTFGRAVEKGKIIVEIGANVALEKNIEQGKQILSKRQQDLEKALQSAQANISELSAAMEKLQMDIENLASKEKPDAAG